jgi:hypothetical protein
MTAVEQHRGLPVKGGQLQSPGCGHVCGLHLCDYTGERSIAQRILGDGKHVHILAALSIKQLCRPDTNLLQCWGIKIEGRHGPAHGLVGFRREARSYARQEKCGGGIVIQAR